MSRPPTSSRSHNGSGPEHGASRPVHEPSSEPDVYLNVPDLHVDEISLDVENLDAHLALQARLANLLELRAGAHVTIDKVDLEIKGVAVKAMLKIRLENVYAILDRALTTIDRNPQVLQHVLDTADHALGPDGAVGGAIEGLGKTAASRATGHRLARIGRGLRGLPRHRPRAELVTKVATAAGVVGGAALAAHTNGGVEKTLKDLTS
jgi:hypothetical protein